MQLSGKTIQGLRELYGEMALLYAHIDKYVDDADVFTRRESLAALDKLKALFPFVAEEGSYPQVKKLQVPPGEYWLMDAADLLTNEDWKTVCTILGVAIHNPTTPWMHVAIAHKEFYTRPWTIGPDCMMIPLHWRHSLGLFYQGWHEEQIVCRSGCLLLVSDTLPFQTVPPDSVGVAIPETCPEVYNEYDEDIQSDTIVLGNATVEEQWDYQKPTTHQRKLEIK